MTTRTRLTRRGQIVLGVLAGLLLLAIVRIALGGSSPGPLVASASAPKLEVVDTFLGEATFYGPGLPPDAVTASGEAFDPAAAAAAHPTLPFGTLLRVTRPPDGPAVLVEVNDRLPDGDPTRLDLTVGAAEVLGLVDAGRLAVRVEVLGESRSVD